MFKISTAVQSCTTPGWPGHWCWSFTRKEKDWISLWEILEWVDNIIVTFAVISEPVRLPIFSALRPSSLIWWPNGVWTACGLKIIYFTLLKTKTVHAKCELQLEEKILIVVLFSEGPVLQLAPLHDSLMSDHILRVFYWINTINVSHSVPLSTGLAYTRYVDNHTSSNMLNRVEGLEHLQSQGGPEDGGEICARHRSEGNRTKEGQNHHNKTWAHVMNKG